MAASPFAYVTPHEKKTKGSFEGIVTLRTAEESKELVGLVDTIVHKAVDVFYRMEKDSGAISDLMRDVRRMNELCATFPPLCSDDEGRNAAQATVQNMERSEQSLKFLFSTYVAGTRLEVATGKKLAEELRGLLRSLVEVTHAMDAEQLKRILRAVKKSFEVILMIKDTTSDFRFEQKAKTYNVNMEVLVKLIDTRVEVLEKGDHKSRLAAAIQAVKDHQQPYLDNTLSAARNPTQDNIARQQEDLRVLLTAVQEIASIIQLPPPKSKYSLDHELVINESLDALRDAVSAGSAAAAADAARRIADELAKMEKDEPDVGEDEDEDAKRRAREALDKACRDLRGLTGGLLAATKNALQHPEDATAKDKVKQMSSAIRDNLKESPFHPKEYDTIQAALPSSGMIQAAADAAEQLKALFQ